MVAAVLPTAALLAFGVLMRQIHQLVAEPADATQRHNTADSSHNSTQIARLTKDGSGQPQPAALEAADRHTDVAQDATNLPELPHPSDEPEGKRVQHGLRGVPHHRSQRATGTGRPRLRRHIEAAIRDKGLSIGRADAEKVKDALQTELDEGRLSAAGRRRQGICPAPSEMTASSPHERTTENPSCTTRATNSPLPNGR
ncbi:hypothetical protein ACRAWF_44960 [Streptomyces sp. L7]